MSKRKLTAQEVVQEVKADYLARREARRSLEAQWQLNINFYVGNQYSYIASNNNIQDYDKQYFWQEKEVFNHIAPMIETRISKITRLNPNIEVLPASMDLADIKSAKLSKEIFKSVSNRLDLPSLSKYASTWCEICGTAFYKITWNSEAGMIVANDDKKSIKEGDVEISVCSPFEILPDNLSCENINDVGSIIHAKAVSVDTIKSVYGVNVEPEHVHSFSLDSGFGNMGGLGYDAHINKITNIELDDHCVLIEKYIKPNKDYPNGRLVIVAGDKLLFDGELPYLNGDNNERVLPFVKQISAYMPGCFYGVSIIERLVPIQRAYNAIRNRKHEYFNRISMGVLTVEDGSVDTDALEQDGLSPGKVLVYRQGGQAPSIMSTPDINAEFKAEEERLMNEFKNLAGVSDLMDDSENYTNLSGTALQLLIEQDDNRVITAIDSAKQALKLLAKHILRLYRQFAMMPRLIKIAGEMGEVEMYYWDKNSIRSDDVVFDTTTALGESIGARRTMLLDLLKSGILYDKDGKFSQSMRSKCLDLLGFGTWEHSTDINGLHVNRAQEENIAMRSQDVEIMPIDNHEIHIEEHISYLLGAGVKDCKNYDEIKNRILAHIEQHKSLQN
ncbi:MAG: hypothetical protein J6Q15_02360 [Clostridia bacterium]|nr:hypothetical protein [Clostridia bacterium]